MSIKMEKIQDSRSIFLTPKPNKPTTKNPKFMLHNHVWIQIQLQETTIKTHITKSRFYNKKPIEAFHQTVGVQDEKQKLTDEEVVEASMAATPTSFQESFSTL